MEKTILITGSTDGIGLETAKMFVKEGHNVLLHGRSADKLAAVKTLLMDLNPKAKIEGYIADLSSLAEVKTLAENITAEHDTIDVLINNAGVYVVANTVTLDGLDTRYTVNTIAPYFLTKLLLPLLGTHGRVINLSSAAQASVEASALTKPSVLSDNAVYAKSKLALTMWSRDMALSLASQGPAIIAVNPASMLGSKMVKQAYGVAGHDLSIGADILIRAALDDEFALASGKYFDNDTGQFSAPHSDALNPVKTREIVNVIETVLAKIQH